MADGEQSLSAVHYRVTKDSPLEAPQVCLGSRHGPFWEVLQHLLAHRARRWRSGASGLRPAEASGDFAGFLSSRSCLWGRKLLLRQVRRGPHKPPSPWFDSRLSNVAPYAGRPPVRQGCILSVGPAIMKIPVVLRVFLTGAQGTAQGAGILCKEALESSSLSVSTTLR